MGGDAAPRVIPVPGGSLSGPLLDRIAEHLGKEGLLAYPTETVYGFGCLARPRALDRLFRLKARDRSQPVLVLVSGPGLVEDLGWTVSARALAESFWPGPLTLVLADPEGRFPLGVRSPAGSVAVRQSPHPVAAAIVDHVDRPLVSTSANVAGEPPARSGAEALQAAERGGAGAELWILDAGELPDSEPSTVVDCSVEPPRVVRAGAVPRARLEAVVAELA